MRKVLSTALILVVLLVFVISCSDIGLTRLGGYENMELAAVGMAGVLFAFQAIEIYLIEPDLVDDMISFDEGDFVTEATYNNFDFKKAYNRLGEENWNAAWDDFYDFDVIIQKGNLKENSKTDTMTIDITYKVTGGEFPGTFHVVGSFSETKESLKVNGRNVDLSGFSN